MVTKKEMRKNLFKLVFVVALMLMVVGCGAKNTKDKSTTNNTTTVTKTTTKTSRTTQDVNTCRIGFSYDDGKLISGELYQVISKGGNAIAPVFSRDGYNYSFDKSLENIIVNTVINVVWTPIDYKITYKNVDGLTNDNPATYNVESSKIDLKSVNKTDYSFLGWYDGDDKITSIEAKTKENITLEARFDRSTKLNYTVKADNTVRINGVDASIDRSTIEEIYIPRVYAGYDVSEIGNYAFSGCSCLTSIAIPNSVTNLGYGIVQNCKALKSVALPNSITSLENYSFYNCSSLTSVTIPDKVTSIGISAFYNCGLTSVAIPDSVETIDEGAFSCCKKTNKCNTAKKYNKYRQDGI